MVHDTADLLDVERVALAEDEGDGGSGVVLPADSIRRAPWHDVMEARKVDCIAIGGWVTLCLLSTDIGS